MSGSGVQLPRKERAGVSLPSYELPELILRDPPKSIHTRKKERVDMSNVTYMLRSDDTRINEGVSYLQRGVNPMVDISYNNSGGGSRTTTMSNIQASNPYKVMKNGAFRPPMFTQEDLLPLSRQKRPESAVSSNPGLNNMNIHNLESMIDREEIHSSIDKTKLNYIAVRPTASFNIQLPQEVFSSSAINQNVLHTSATASIQGPSVNSLISTDPLNVTRDVLYSTTTANPSTQNNINRDDSIDVNNYIKDNVILQNISPNFSILLYNPDTRNYSEVFASTREKLNIAVQSSLNRPIDLTRDDGTQIKVKDYRWKVVNSNANKDILVLQVKNPDIELSRNTPLYAVGSNVSGNTKVERFHTVDPITENKVKTSASSSISMKYGRNDPLYNTENNVNLRGMGSLKSSLENFGSVPTISKRSIPTLNSKLTYQQGLDNRFSNY